MDASQRLSTTSLYTSWPALSGLPFVEEVRDMVSNAHGIAVNIMGPRDERERRLFLKQAPNGLNKDRVKAHKMLFVYGTSDAGLGGGSDLNFGYRWIVGVASFMLGNLSAPLTGDDLTLRRYAVSECERIDEELEQLSQYRQHRRRESTARALAEMLFHEREIFSILKHNAEMTLILRIGLIASAVVGFVGAMLAIADLLSIGAAGMFGCACAMLLKTGFDSTSFQVRREAVEMRRFVDYLLQVGWLFTSSHLHYPLPSRLDT